MPQASLQKLLAVNQELETRAKENLARTYVPNGKGDEFIKMVGSNAVFVNLFIAANGVGKSASGANIVTNICFGPQNDYFRNLPLFEKFPYLKRGRIISDPTTLKEKIIPELKKWFPSNRYTEHYATTKQGKPFEAKWITDTGFEFDLMSNEQDTKEFESTDLGWVWFDEPVRKDIYSASVARTRTGGIIFGTLTPLEYSAWIQEDLYDKADGKLVDYVEADMEDNCKIHGVRGILEHANIERQISQWPEDEVEARAHGKFGHLLGRIIKSFNRKIHVIRPFEMKVQDYNWYMALDTHPQKDDHALWMAEDSQGNKFAVGEIVTKGTIAYLAAQYRNFEQSMRIEGRLIDPSAYNRDERSDEPSVVDRFKTEGFDFMPGSKDLVNGIRRMQDAFGFTMVGNEFVKKPEIFIFDTCPILIKQIESYVWVKNKGKAADSKQDRGIPIDKNDHQPENLRRLLMYPWNFVPYNEGQGFRGIDGNNGGGIYASTEVNQDNHDPY